MRHKRRGRTSPREMTMTSDAVLTLILCLPAIAVGAAHAIVWAFYPEAR